MKDVTINEVVFIASKKWLTNFLSHTLEYKNVIFDSLWENVAPKVEYF